MSRRSCLSTHVICIGVVVWAAMAATGGGSGPSGCNVLHISDFHWDPYYGTPEGLAPCTASNASQYGEYGCDAPYALIQSAVRAGVNALVAASSDSMSDCLVALYTGDWVRHGAPSMPNNANEDMVWIWKNLSTLLEQEMMGALQKVVVAGERRPFVHVVAHPNIAGVDIGNEDFNPDYHLDVNHTNTSLLRNYSGALRDAHLLSNESAESFAYCGYFMSEVQPPNMTEDGGVVILSLNTVIYTFLLTPKTTALDPCGQFSWMASQLSNARSQGKRVWIVAHVPPVSELWDLNYFGAFESILMEFQDVIAAHFYGHTHATSFGVIANDSAVAPMFISGSVTRVSHTNPCFQLYEVDKMWRVLGWNQWYLDPAYAWQSLDVKAVLQLPDLSSVSLFHAGEVLRTNSTFFQSFYAVFEGGFVPPGVTCDWICQHIVSCSAYALSLASIVGCLL